MIVWLLIWLIKPLIENLGENRAASFYIYAWSLNAFLVIKKSLHFFSCVYDFLKALANQMDGIVEFLKQVHCLLK